MKQLFNYCIAYKDIRIYICDLIPGKMMARGAITCKLLAKLLVKSGVAHVITMDLHQKEIQGFFDCPVDNLRASPFLVRYIQESVSKESESG